MSCSRYHVLLSQNLDGRLSSTRRDALLDHLAECADCAHLSEEMRVAQDLALRLPPERTTSSFQETLWERVQSGEGTPDAVFNDPVPVAKRIRYAASGAAAAALFLVALNWMTPPSEQLIESDEPRNQVVVAKVQDDGAPPNVALRPETMLASHGLEKLNPASAAQQARLSTVENLKNLRQRAPRLRSKLNTESSLASVRQEIEAQIIELRSAVGVLHAMVDGQFIRLENEFQTELAFVDRGIETIETASDVRGFENGLVELSRIRAERLNQRFFIVCCDPVATFQQRMCDMIVQDPSVGVVLRLVVPGRTVWFNPTNPNELIESVRVLPKQLTIRGFDQSDDR